jgi:hypothetical protein
VNLNSARQTRDGFLVRVKRRIKPGGDAAKEFARNIPVVSTAANWATLGLFKRALKSDGEAVRATWLAMNCKEKSFNVSNDGYSWQNIYKDPYGQAEDLYFQFCEANQKDAPPPYLSLTPADAEMPPASGGGGGAERRAPAGPPVAGGCATAADGLAGVRRRRSPPGRALPDPGAPPGWASPTRPGRRG